MPRYLAFFRQFLPLTLFPPAAMALVLGTTGHMEQLWHTWTFTVTGTLFLFWLRGSPAPRSAEPLFRAWLTILPAGVLAWRLSSPTLWIGDLLALMLWSLGIFFWHRRGYRHAWLTAIFLFPLWGTYLVGEFFPATLGGWPFWLLKHLSP